jgi:acyl-coenzyme A synthetase/AMP-(fatty) acid ligase
MPSGEILFLRQAVSRGPQDSAITLGTLPVNAIRNGRSLEDRPSFAGRSVLVMTADQLEAALALIDLDGLARRLVLCPPDVRHDQLPSIVKDAGIDAIVCSTPDDFRGLGVEKVAKCRVPPLPTAGQDNPVLQTEWLLLTSGTTGSPKMAVHTLQALTGAIKPMTSGARAPTWATFYDIRRYGGLQIFLRAILGGGSLVLSDPDEQVADHLERLAAAGVTHISGTPTHWRRVVMNSAASKFRPGYVRLSGEIADQAILDALKAAYPEASIGHAFASTEAGVCFEVTDGLAGFPVSFLDGGLPEVDLKIVDGSMRVRSARTASAYAGRPDLMMVDADGYVDTGDMIEIRNSRCYFAGRRGGIINVGGLKVHPEEVEDVVNRHPLVHQTRVKSRRSPIIGAIVVADVVLKTKSVDTEGLRDEILELCRASLATHKVPAVINFVEAITTTAGGKLSRQNA